MAERSQTLPADFELSSAMGIRTRNHGIGRFQKLEKLAISGEVRDYLVVKYADGILRVSAEDKARVLTL